MFEFLVNEAETGQRGRDRSARRRFLLVAGLIRGEYIEEMLKNVDWQSRLEEAGGADCRAGANDRRAGA